jgi:signal transduction histidine kinase/ligand-binding sensor domain-containing protein
MYQTTRRAQGAIGLWCIGLCLLHFASPAHSLSPEVSLTQLGHIAWRVQDGILPASPNAITQTTDGYIWIGTRAGLIRFDGATFVPFAPDGQGLLSPSVIALHGAADGSLWIGTSNDLERWKDGRLRRYTDRLGLFEAVQEGADGSIWASRSHTDTDDAGALCQALEKSLRCYGPRQGMPFIYAGPALAIERSGAIWIGMPDQLARWEQGHSQIISPAGLAASHGLDGFNSVVVAPDGSIWSGVQYGGPGLGLQHLTGQRWEPLVIGDTDTSTWEVTTLLFDRDHTLWVGTVNRGIYRIAGGRIDHLGQSDGLSDDAINGLFEDREGSVWVATTKGVDKFRQTRVVTFSLREGLSANEANAVLTSRTGAIWIGNHDALDRLDSGAVSTYRQRDGLPGKQVTALFEDRQGRVWIGVDDGVAVFNHGKFTKIRSEGPPIGPVLEFVESSDATVWAASAIAPSRLVRINQSRALEFISPPQDAASMSSLISGPNRTLWVALRTGRNASALAQFRDGRWDVVLRRPPNTGTINEMVAPDEHTVFAATTTGVVEWRDGIARTLGVESGLPCPLSYSLVFDRNGNLWVSLLCGLAILEHEQLESWWREPSTKLHVHLLDTYDGALPARPDFHPRSARAPDGKLWFVNGNVLQSVDPGHLPHNDVIPNVTIQSLFGDGRSYDPHSTVQLPSLTRNVQIDFTAPSFVVPQRVRFRYRLEGWDPEWQDPGARRQSFYTNLRPGTYRFAVSASNDDGLWNNKGASIGFTILPAFYQTQWFYVLSTLGCGAILASLHRVRMRQVAAQVRGRLEARLAERERIARELHDTLLQGIQGLIWRFQAVAARIPTAEPARQLAEQSLDRADRLLAESRDKVKDLRPLTQGTANLAQALAAEGEQFAQLHPTESRVTVQGVSRDLHPLVHEETLLIAREALGNAFRHANARSIEVEVTYGDGELQVRIRDDGQGISTVVQHAGGKPGHFGLIGMRERAEKLGAQLEVWSRPGAGTEVDLRVPARVAYRSATAATGRTSSWLGGFLSVQKSREKSDT